MKNLRYTTLVLVFNLIALVLKAQTPEIVVNEIYNGPTRNDEWTELIVVKDNLDIRSWFIGDNNGGTDSWQPKFKFRSIPFWNNLRAGTIIIIDHATNIGTCNDITDVDKSDGFIRICCRNTTYFENGTGSSLDINGSGDFIQIVNTNQRMVHGLGFDENPGLSVAGGSCSDTNPLWTEISGNGSGPARPCSNFLFLKSNIDPPNTSVIAKAENILDFLKLVQDPENPYIGLSETPLEGIGNGGANDQFIKDLRTPKIDSQKVCLSRGTNNTVLFSWLPAIDVFPSDNTTGYMVVRNTTENFTNPQNGREYALNSLIGTGIVVGVINNSATVTFADSPGPGNFFYRVYAFRYKNTTSSDHPTRGRAYNTAKFVTVNPTGNFLTTIISDTICEKGKVTLFAGSPVPLSKVAWFSTETSNDTLPGGKTTTFIDSISQSRSYWASVSLNGCSQRFEVKAVINPLVLSYTANETSCGGKVVPFTGNNGPGHTYKWSLIDQNIPGVSTTRSDSINFQITTPLTLAPGTPIIYNVEVTRTTDLCTDNKRDTLYITPLTVSYQALDSACGGQNIAISAPRRTGISYKWTINTPAGYSKFFNSDSTLFEVENIPASEQKKRIDFSIMARDAAGCISVVKSDSIIVVPILVEYLAADSICEGTPATFLGANPNLRYSWNLGEPRPALVKTSKADSSIFEIAIPSYPEKRMLYFNVSAKNNKGCQSVIKKDSLYTVPFNASIVSNPTSPTLGDSIVYSVKSNLSNYYVSQWTVSNGTILSKNPRNLIATSTSDSIKVMADISTLLPTDGLFCKVSSSLKIKVEPIPLPPLKPINNLISNNGDLQNNTLSFDRRTVKNLEIFNRWGKKVHSASLYQNDWKPEEKEEGTYFYTAEVKEPTETEFKKIADWVQVVK